MLAWLLPWHLTAAEVVERGGFRFEHGPIPEWVAPLDTPAAWPADAPGADASGLRTWSIDWHTSLRGAEPVYYNELIVEPIRANRVADAARHEFDFNPDYQTLRIHGVDVRRDGRWENRFRAERVTLARRESRFESDMETGQVSALIVVEDVRPGDLVRMRWSVIGSNPVLQSMTHDRYTLAWFDPILSLRLRMDLPPGPRPEVLRVGDAPAPRWSRQTDGERLELHRERLAAVPREDRVPSGEELLPALEIASERTWAAVVDWALPLYGSDDPLPEDLQARVAEWQREQPDAAILAALQTVQEEVRYHAVLLGQSTHRPTPPAQTWARRFGDCKDKALLLTRILRQLGLDATPALVSMERGIGVEQSLPAATQFDHVIVRLRRGDQTLWLDPTLNHQAGPLPMRRAYDYGVALAIAEGVDALERMGPPPLSRSDIRERYDIEADGHIVLTVETAVSGPIAESRRQDWLGADADTLQRQLADYYRRLHGELEVLAPPELEDDDDGVLTLRERYRLTQPWVAQSGSVRQFDAYADSLRDFVAVEGVLDRRHALALAHPIEIRQHSEFRMPQGWQALDRGETQDVEDSGVRYRRIIEMSEQTVRIDHQFQTLADRVAPADLKTHFESLRTLTQLLGARVTFQPSAGSLQQQREHRLRGLLRDSVRTTPSREAGE